MSPTALRLRVIRSISDIDPARWDACANPENPAGELRPPERAAADLDVDSNSQIERFNPFLCHRFLSALETSKSAVARQGWGGSHLLVEDEERALLAAAPAWLKSHSMGEYVFDHAWADAFERAGGDYYPKLQVAVPFTPATGRRLLVAKGEREEEASRSLIAGLRALRENAGCSSTHVTFPVRSEWEALGASGWLQRTGRQFHFFNRGYADFDAFLAALSSRKRKNIRKEREQALAPGIEVFSLTGAAIEAEHWDAFFEFYIDTGSRKWGTPYLTRAFFSEVGRTMADRILLVMARRAGRWIAGAINFIGDDALYGRNWGAIEEHPCLHFELCYYRAIDYALANGLSRVEAGAQGEHKLARGYEPVTTYSAHEFADPRLARAVAAFLVQERDHVEAEIEIYGEHVPFKKG